MRDKLLIILLFALVAVNCQAQRRHSSAQMPIFGVSMGANFANLIGTDKIDDSKPRIGMT